MTDPEHVEMVVDLVTLRPRRPRQLRQTIQDRFALSVNEAREVVRVAIAGGLIELDWHGNLCPGHGGAK